MRWFRHGLPMLLIEGQYVQPKWPAPLGQPRPKLPNSRWQQLLHEVIAGNPEWGDTPQGRLRAEVATQQMQVEAARKAFGQPGLQHPEASVQQPATQTGVQAVQGRNGRVYHRVPLKPEAHPWCIFCKEGGHSTAGCLPFACPTLLGDDGLDPFTGEKVSSTPGHLDARPAVPAIRTLYVCSAARRGGSQRG